MLPHAITLAIVAPLSSKTAKLFLRLPYGGVITPPQYFRNGRAEICPNPYARGDCTRPCYAGRRSVKRELL